MREFSSGGCCAQGCAMGLESSVTLNLGLASHLKDARRAATTSMNDTPSPAPAMQGHEDWAFWLQLTRLPLQSRRIDAFLTLYRYKTNSKMRNRERSNPEVRVGHRGLIRSYFYRQFCLVAYRISCSAGPSAIALSVSRLVSGAEVAHRPS